MNKKMPLVSVVVPTRNSSQFLFHCLSSIKKQSYKNIELIVVDNYSTDDTKSIALRFTSKVYDRGPERSAQRNYGALQSKGDYLLFIDSDMQLTSDVVKECVESSGVSVIIPEKSFGSGFWAQCKALEKEMYIGDDDIEAARFFERKLFFMHQGYDEKIAGGGEDWDLPNRIKNSGIDQTRISAPIYHNEGRLRIFNAMKKKFYYAKTIHRYIARHPELSSRQLRLFRPAFLRNRRKLLRDPITCLGVFILKICEYSAGGLGYLISKTR